MYSDHRAFAQAGSASPFRSEDQDEREVAAAAMLQQRAIELRSLQAALATATPRAKKALRLRIQATKNNAQAWEDYLAGKCDFPVTSPEPRAVMTPYVFPNPLKVTK